MTALRELQRDWRHYLLTEETSPLDEKISPPLAGNILDRLLIYSDGYHLRLQEVLEKTFPRLKEYVGDDVFLELSAEYIAAYPSRYYLIDEFPQHFAEFFLAKKNSFCAEFAQFEYAICRTIDSADATLLTLAQLQAIKPERWGNVIFVLHPSVTLWNMKTNAPAVLDGLIKGQAKESLAMKKEKSHWRLWRKGLQIIFCPATAIENTFLENIQRGLSFAEIGELLCKSMPEDQVSDYAIAQLLRWLNEGLLSSVHYKGKS